MRSGNTNTEPQQLLRQLSVSWQLKHWHKFPGSQKLHMRLRWGSSLPCRSPDYASSAIGRLKPAPELLPPLVYSALLSQLLLLYCRDNSKHWCLMLLQVCICCCSSAESIQSSGAAPSHACSTVPVLWREVPGVGHGRLGPAVRPGQLAAVSVLRAAQQRCAGPFHAKLPGWSYALDTAFHQVCVGCRPA